MGLGRNGRTVFSDRIRNKNQDFREEQNVAEEKALPVRLAEKAREFVATGSEIYQGNLPDGAKEHH